MSFWGSCVFCCVKAAYLFEKNNNLKQLLQVFKEPCICGSGLAVLNWDIAFERGGSLKIGGMGFSSNLVGHFLQFLKKECCTISINLAALKDPWFSMQTCIWAPWIPRLYRDDCCIYGGWFLKRTLDDFDQGCSCWFKGAGLFIVKYLQIILVLCEQSATISGNVALKNKTGHNWSL